MISKIGQILSLAGIIALAACGDDATTTAPVTTNACTTPVSASAQVTVTSPNCGGTWKVGDTISFAWKVGSDFGTAKVQLKLPNGSGRYPTAFTTTWLAQRSLRLVRATGWSSAIT